MIVAGKQKMRDWLVSRGLGVGAKFIWAGPVRLEEPLAWE